MLGTHLGRRVVPAGNLHGAQDTAAVGLLELEKNIGQRDVPAERTQTEQQRFLAARLAGRRLLACAIGLAVPGNRLGSSETAAYLRLQTHPHHTTAASEHVGNILADGVEDVMIVPKLAGVADAVPVTLRPGRAVLQVERTALLSKAVTTDGSQVIDEIAGAATRNLRALDKAALLQGGQGAVGSERVAVETRVDDRLARRRPKLREQLQDAVLALLTVQTMSTAPIAATAQMNLRTIIELDDLPTGGRLEDSLFRRLRIRTLCKLALALKSLLTLHTRIGLVPTALVGAPRGR